MSQAASLTDDLVEEILLRLPPDDPGSLLCAALVCKAWCRLISGPGFNRRFREFHCRRKSPPVLGFFCRVHKPSDTCSARSVESRFVPLSSSFHCLPHAFMPNWRAVDARHGRILFYDKDAVWLTAPESLRVRLIVWNPITGESSTLPVVPMYTAYMDGWNAALLCDHVDGHFRVVVVARDNGFTSACVYSSEQHVWSTPVLRRQQSGYFRLLRGRNALIGNALYFKCDQNKILEYDMCKQELSVVSLPSKCKSKCIALMTAEDGGLGFAVARKFKLYTWSWEAGLTGDGRWAQRRVFELDKLLPSSALFTRIIIATRVVAVENALSAVFIRTCTGLFVIDLKFARVLKIYERSRDSYMKGFVPYTSFCTPVVRSIY